MGKIKRDNACRAEILEYRKIGMTSIDLEFDALMARVQIISYRYILLIKTDFLSYQPGVYKPDSFAPFHRDVGQGGAI